MKDPKLYKHCLIGLLEGSVVYWLIVGVTGYVEVKTSLSSLIGTGRHFELQFFSTLVSLAIMMMPIWYVSSIVGLLLSIYREKKQKLIIASNLFYLALFLFLITFTWVVFYFFIDVYVDLRGWSWK